MINRIKSLFLDPQGAAGASSRPGRGSDRRMVDALHLAAAALLVEAACLDGHFDGAERARIEALVQARFGLSAEETETLIEAAESEVADASQLLHFTRVIKDRFGHKERVEMIEMLWEVVYADGVLHDYEANLMRRIGGLVYVTDQERGAARKRALARMKAAG
ncbi:MAG: TerB family tellurite resistance protein [Alphaproteobacteria bacterium]